MASLFLRRRPDSRIRACLAEGRFQLLHDIGMILGNVVGFAGIGLQIIKLNWLAQSMADAFPASEADRLVEPALVGFPVKGLVPVGLRLPQEGGKKG